MTGTHPAPSAVSPSLSGVKSPTRSSVTASPDFAALGEPRQRFRWHAALCDRSLASSSSAAHTLCTDGTAYCAAAPDKGDTTADRLAARSARYTDWRVAVSSQSIVSTVTNEVQFLVPCPVSDLQRPESDPRVPSRLGQPPPGPAPWILHLAFGVPFRGGEHAAHERRMVATQFV